MSTRAVATAALPVAALFAIVLLIGALGSWQAEPQSPLRGVSPEDFAQMRFAPPEPGAVASITAEEAIAAASERSLPAEDVAEAVLLQSHHDGRLVWAVNFEPSSVIPILPTGGCYSKAPVMKVDFKVTTIDAETGEWLGGRVSQDILSEQDCQFPRAAED